jgi:hypothetical protein
MFNLKLIYVENELKHENAALRFENAKLKFETLFNERPSTIRSFAFHGSLRIFYLIIGWIAFIIALWYAIFTAGLMLAKDEALNWALENFGDKAPFEFIANTLIPTHFVLALLGLSFSICILIMARLCQKIVKRNMYIMDLENIWMDLKEK